MKIANKNLKLPWRQTLEHLRDKSVDEIYCALNLVFDITKQSTADIFCVNASFALHQPADCGCRSAEHPGTASTLFEFEVSVGVSNGFVESLLKAILHRMRELFGCMFHDAAAHARRSGDGSACRGSNAVVASTECVKHIKVPLLDQLACFVTLPRRQLCGGRVAIVQP